MKFRYWILTLLVITLLTTGVMASDQHTYLWDEADVLTAEEEAALNSDLAQISQELGVSVIAATVLDEATYSVESLANDFFAEHSNNQNGVILFLAFGTIDNDYYIGAQGETQTIFTEKVYDKVENACVSRLRSHDYEGAISAYAKACKKQISSYGKMPLIGIVICVVIGIALSFLIPMNILKGQLKSVRYQPAASSYVRANSLRFSQKRDTFLYRNVTRTARPKNNSSGSRSGGGGGHHGRSGKF